MHKHENYEKNLMLNYEAIRKDLDILLTSTIPTQKNLIKTYVWINTLLIAYCLTALVKYTGMIEKGMLVLVLAFSALSIIISLKSLYYGTVKAYGHIHISSMGAIKEDAHEHINGLNKMANSDEERPVAQMDSEEIEELLSTNNKINESNEDRDTTPDTYQDKGERSTDDQDSSGSKQKND